MDTFNVFLLILFTIIMGVQIYIIDKKCGRPKKKKKECKKKKFSVTALINKLKIQGDFKMTVNMAVNEDANVLLLYTDVNGGAAKVEDFVATSQDPAISPVEVVEIKDYTDTNGEVGTSVALKCAPLTMGKVTIDTTADGHVGGGVVAIAFPFDLDISDLDAASVNMSFTVTPRV